MEIDKWTAAVTAMRQQIAALEQRASTEVPSSLLQETFEALHATLEQLDLTGEELRQQHHELLTAQLEVETERQRYRDLFEFAPDGYLVTDATGRIGEVNQAAGRMLNFAPKFLVGKLLLTFIHPESQRTFLEMLFRLHHGKTVEEWIGQITRRKAGSFYAAMTASPVYDAEGQVSQVRWMIRDIHERVMAEQRAHRYAHRLRHLHMIDRALLAARSPIEIVDVTLNYVQALIPCQHASIMIFAQERDQAIIRSRSFTEDVPFQGEVPLSAVQPLMNLAYGQQRLIPDVEALSIDGIYSPVDEQLYKAGMRTTLSVPLVTHAMTIGILAFGAVTPDAFTEEHATIAQEVADQLAIAIQQSRLFAEVQMGRQRLATLSRQLLETQENERRTIARELHDEIGQALTGLQITLELARREVTPQQQARLNDADTIVSELMQRVSELSLNLRPSVLDNLGVLPALVRHINRYTAQTGIQVDFWHHNIERRFPPAIETVVYRVVQETLTNIARHAETTTVQIQISADDQTLTIEIKDQGCGFDLPTALNSGTSSGVSGMYERVSLVNGKLHIDTAPGKGTLVIAEIPLTTPEQAISEVVRNSSEAPNVFEV